VIDIIVLTSLMFIGIIISISANYPYFRSRIYNLEALLKDVHDEEAFKIREIDIRLRKKLTLALFVLLGIVGIIALIFILVQP
jgi:hypothetical protein